MELSRFHPAVQRVKAIIDGGELGAVKHVEVQLAVPEGSILKADDIRSNYELGGGGLMDMGCMRFFPLRFDQTDP